MIKGYDLIVFSDDWGRHPSSCQHLIKRFLPFNRVLWINSVGLRSPQMSEYDLRRIFEKIKSWLFPLSHPEENLWVFSLFSLPWNQSSLIRRINQWLGLRQIRALIRKLGFEKLISLTTVPNACDWVGALAEKFKIYYCVDDFSEWPGMERGLILKMEEQLRESVDLLVVTAVELIERKQINRIPTLLLPHGVDIAHFAEASKPINPVARRWKFPCIGYFGSIDERLDFNLIEHLAKAKPEWSFVFVGPHISYPAKLKEIHNCTLLPPVSYKQLPKILREFDALILPYVKSKLTRSINPLKLRECLVTSKPIIAVRLPEIDKFSNLVYAAESPDEFIDKLELALSPAENNTRKVDSSLLTESWDAKAEILSDRIEEGFALIKI